MRRGAALAAMLLVGAVSCGSPAPPVGPLTVIPSTAAADPDDSTGGGNETVVAAAGHPCAVVDSKADTKCTPGIINPDVTQATIRQTVCTPGWSSTVRPPVAYTNKIKRIVMMRYGVSGKLSDYELDHLVAIEDGGFPGAVPAQGMSDDPRTIANLWPELWNGPKGARVKDVEENQLHADVCAGRISLVTAQRQLIHDWTHS